MRIALATCRELPEPDHDQELLLGALRALGAETDMAAWDDPRVVWREYDLCVIRSTWNYIHDLPAFLAWARKVSAKTRLLNPWKIVRWNSDKGYLKDLEARGFPIVPTEFHEPGLRTLEEIVDPRGWGEIVIKPRVGAASFETRRFAKAEREAAGRFLKAASARRPMLIQPYVPSVDGRGERSVVWIDGRITHTMRKSPRLHGQDESANAVSAAADERALALSLLEPYRREILYARVDLARDEQGGLMVMELELIEPSLFLAQSRGALDRFSSGIVAAALEKS